MVTIQPLRDINPRDARESVVEPTREDLRRSWGITPGYWLFPTPIKILFVIDGRIDLSTGQFAFGLGFVLDTLRAPFSAAGAKF